MCVRSQQYPEHVGAVGTIVEGLAVRPSRRRDGTKCVSECYRVLYPNTPSPHESRTWLTKPSQLIKLGGPDVDISESESKPIRESIPS